MLDNETRRRIDAARDILVGKLPDPKSQVEQITIALIYKFMDDMDKEAVEFGGEPTFFSGEYEKYSWTNIFDPKVGGFEMLTLYSEAIIKLNLNPNIPQLFRDIFKNAYLPYRDPETLKLFLKTINEFHYDHSEKLGDAFEYLLSVLGSQGDAGQFRTPRHIIDFIVQVMQPKKNETICDPACGTAGFLISAYKYILKQNSGNSANGENSSPFRGGREGLTPDDRKKLMQHFVGYDISPDMVRLSLVNMYLHNFTSPRVYEYDTLTSEDRWGEYFDIILANPPFMSPKGGIKPHKKFSLQANRSEVLFVDYIAEHINPTTGRAGIIVPEGIIFQSGKAYKQLRQMLVDKRYLYAVVSLPAGIFQPYSGVKTSVLLMDRTLAKKTDNILFVKIENDGFDLGAQRRAIEKNDLTAALIHLQEYKDALINNTAFVSDNKNVFVVDKKKIAGSGDYNLSVDRYRVNEKSNKSDFEIVRLGDVATLEYGYTDIALDAGDARFIRITDISEDGFLKQDENKFIKLNDESRKYLLQKNDLLVARTGATFGKTMFYNEDYPSVFASYLIRIRFNKENVISRFYWSFTRSDVYWKQATELVSGGGQPQFNANAIKEIKFPLPPLPIQQEIVAKIEIYQRIIDGAKQVVENYKPEIDIDPGWEMVELGEVAELIMGQSPEGETYNTTGEGMPLVNGPVEFGPEPFSKTVKTKFTTKPTKQCKEGDLILCVRGSTTGRMNIAGFDGCIGRGVAAIRAKEQQEWLNFYFSTIEVKIHSLGTGSTFPNVTTDTLKSLKIPFPPSEIRLVIINHIEREQKLVNANKELIKIYEQKIKDEINKLWQPVKKEVVYEENEKLSMVAEE